MNYHTLWDYHKITQGKYHGLAVIFLGFSFPLCFAQVDQSITMTTNKDSYMPGDTVQLTGLVTGQPSTLVALQVKDSDGNLVLIRTVQADENGNFAIQFKIPPTVTSGKFSITASTKVNGFVVTQDKVFDASVPEFSFVAPILFASLISIIVLTKRINRQN
jgi:hypothetical protein